MDETPSKKFKKYPDNVCQYRTNCYRKNPVHFEQYSHPHIQAIVEGDRVNGEYVIPSTLAHSKDIVQAQCEIVEKIFGSNSQGGVNQPPAKKVAVEQETEAANSEVDMGCLPSRSVSRETGAVPKSPVHQPRENSSTTPRNTATESKPTRHNDSERETKKQMIRKAHDFFDVVPEKGKMAEKLAQAHPYNFFLTAVTASKVTHTEPLSTTFMELLDSSLGDLESSVHINFMVDLGWLMANYFFAGHEEKPMIILYGDETEDLRTISQTKPNITTVRVNMPGPFSIHHSKVSIFCYKDGSSRIVVSTANLYVDDWHNRTQGLWISPLLTPIVGDADTAAGESPTGFRDDFVRYLVSYGIAKIQPLIARLRRTDFSAVNVLFVASVPGTHRDVPNRGPPWGHPRAGYLLSKHSAPITDDVPVVAQSSSIGSLGPNLNAFIGTEWMNSFRRDSTPLGIRRVPRFKMIYPSYSNVKNSYDDLLGGGCLPYRRANDVKQQWLKEHLFQWRSNCRNRTRAMPHIKTYCRWSDEGVYWFLLTSANLSKAAWGSFNKSSKLEQTIRVNNYEAGVLFLPKFMGGGRTFPLGRTLNGSVPPFPMPYDIPLTPYSPEDIPFVMDHLEYYVQQKQ